MKVRTLLLKSNSFKYCNYGWSVGVYSSKKVPTETDISCVALYIARERCNRSVRCSFLAISLVIVTMGSMQVGGLHRLLCARIILTKYRGENFHLGGPKIIKFVRFWKIIAHWRALTVS